MQRRFYFGNLHNCNNTIKKEPFFKKVLTKGDLFSIINKLFYAEVAELADAHVWGACGSHHTGSSPVFRTTARDGNSCCGIWRSRVAGRARTIGNRVTVRSRSRVRISPSPPMKKALKLLVFSAFSRLFHVLVLWFLVLNIHSSISVDHSEREKYFLTVYQRNSRFHWVFLFIQLHKNSWFFVHSQHTDNA